ncbi:MAG: HD-GYP domain-containing protein [Clostridia bacterium]|nr:HD-GYP domain-containing protein [Clostridia bacterium]
MRLGNIANNHTNEEVNNNHSYKILAVDDEVGIIDSLSIFLKRSGYSFTGITDPMEAVERLKNEHFDLLLLDFIMTPLHGDQVVEEIRKFNKELYIILLTGHKDLAPPLETIKRLDIQGYCEKSDKFDQLLLLIESGIKSVEQMNEIKKINNELSETYNRLEQAYMESIQTVRYTVEAKDTYTRGHSDRVSEYSVLIGKKLNLNDDDIKRLRVGGLFHDVGKIGVPDSILQKNAKLTDDEYSEIKNHPTIGAHILSTASIFQDILPIVKHHHERYDGKGYPGKLDGEKIPYLARITAIADAFDAMTSRRVYRDSLPLDVVIAEFEKNKGTQFDPKLADVFLDILKNEPDSIKEIQEKYN